MAPPGASGSSSKSIFFSCLRKLSHNKNDRDRQPDEDQRSPPSRP